MVTLRTFVSKALFFDLKDTFICQLFLPLPTLDENECLTAGVCKFGGTCVNFPGGFRCDCPLGRTGKHCETGELHALPKHVHELCLFYMT